MNESGVNEAALNGSADGELLETLSLRPVKFGIPRLADFPPIVGDASSLTPVDFGQPVLHQQSTVHAGSLRRVQFGLASLSFGQPQDGISHPVASLSPVSFGAAELHAELTTNAQSLAGVARFGDAALVTSSSMTAASLTPVMFGAPTVQRTFGAGSLRPVGFGAADAVRAYQAKGFAPAAIGRPAMAVAGIVFEATGMEPVTFGMPRLGATSYRARTTMPVSFGDAQLQGGQSC